MARPTVSDFPPLQVLVNQRVLKIVQETGGVPVRVVPILGLDPGETTGVCKAILLTKLKDIPASEESPARRELLSHLYLGTECERLLKDGWQALAKSNPQWSRAPKEVFMPWMQVKANAQASAITETAMAGIALRDIIRQIQAISMNAVVVSESYRIYSWKTKQHTWASLFTPRLIGALQFITADLEMNRTICPRCQGLRH